MQPEQGKYTPDGEAKSSRSVSFLCGGNALRLDVNACCKEV
jgi:hypothetical protein